MIKSKDYVLNLARNTVPMLAYSEGLVFEEWQDKAKTKLAELLGLPFADCSADFCVVEKTQHDGYISIAFTFQSEPGYHVPCTLLVPSGAQLPLPGVICLQGHSRGAHISLGIPKFPEDVKSIAGGRDFALQAVSEGYCAIVLEQRYMGVMGQAADGRPACFTDNAAMGSLLLGRTAIGERVWDIHRLIDVILENLTGYIDTAKIVCLGNSGGGTATFYAACYDERISLAVPSCAVCTYEDSIMAMSHCPCNFVPGIRTYFNMGDLGALIAPRPVIVVCGKDDDIFPIHGVKASFDVMRRAYKAVGKEELCRLIVGDGGHQFYPGDVWPVVRMLLDV
ncbi:MAG: hypothetical protein IJZ85_08005 [Lachnospiraceae bacterium]|nr:hypothetical protein [Lachnospiraceae bacterium]